MTDRPIIFSAPMIRALLAGTKTQTRRVLKRQPPCAPDWHIADMDEGCVLLANDADDYVRNPVPFSGATRLWVREAITRFDKGTCDQHVWYRAGRNEVGKWLASRCPGIDPDAPWPHAEGPAGGLPYNVSPIFMPRWASRITLHVEEVRVQRVQDISEEDARAEGAPWEDCWPTYRQSFEAVWDSIHGPGAFERNDWVAAITFRVTRANIDAPEAA